MTLRNAFEGLAEQATLAAILASTTRSLTERMLARAPSSGYSLFVDTADVAYIYVAEAPTADEPTVTSARGIRVIKDATGNPLGKVQIATGFAWNSRGGAIWQ